MNNDRRYAAAPPLRINLQTRENVYTGIEPANNFWRNKIATTFDFSQPLKDLLAAAAYTRAKLIVEIHGHVENPNHNDQRPYMQKMSTPVVFGPNRLSDALDAAIAAFKVSKRTADEPGYVASGNIIVLTHAIIKLIHAQEAEGGATLYRADMVELTSPDDKTTIIAANPSARMPYLRYATNACLFRCLYHQLSGPRKKWFKNLGTIVAIKRSIGLSKEEPVPVSKAFQFCDMHDIELKLTVFDGTSFTQLTSPRHADHQYKFMDINLVLDMPNAHYMVLFHGRIAPETRGKSTQESVCRECGEAVDFKSMQAHALAHVIAAAETKDFEITTTNPERAEGESLESYGARYCNYFVDLIDTFVNDKECTSILWFAGPGGCGKSHVIKQFIEKRSELNVECLSHTGVAAQNIGGRTIESYLSTLQKKSDFARENLPDVLIIDEISMSSMQQFERLNRLFNRHNPAHAQKLFGGCKVILMGDFCQLEVISTTKDPALPMMQSPLFTRYVIPVPMLYGFRYKDDPKFYEFLCRLRENKVDFNSFKDLGWKFCTRDQLVKTFKAQDRPVFMSFQNDVVNQVVTLIQEHDTRIARAVTRIPSDIYEVCLTRTFLTPPSHLHFDEIFQSEVDHSKLGMTLVTNPMKDLFTKALVEEVAKPSNMVNQVRWQRDTDCQINTTIKEFYAGQKLMITKNYCDRHKSLMNGEEVTFEDVNADNDTLIVKDSLGECRAVSRIWRGLVKDGKVYIAHGYPIQSAAAFTGHKSQGKTFQTAAIFLPRPGRPVPHLYYVMLSRCVSAKNLYFIFEEKKIDADHNELVSLAYDRLFGQNGRSPLVCYNKVATELMEYSKRGKPMSQYGVDLENLDNDEISSILFPAHSNLKLWEPSLPVAINRSEFGDHLLFDDLIVYDIETGAASDAVNHPDFFDGDAYVSHSNAARLTMTEWMISFYHIINGKVLMLHNSGSQRLQRFAKYQQPDGQVIFHRGEFTDDPDLDKWCSQMFFDYLMAYAAIKANIEEHHANRRRKRQTFKARARTEGNPCYLVGFNIDSFDTKSLLQRFTDMAWPDKFFPFIIPNSGTAITQLQIRAKVMVDQKSTQRAFIASHDVFRLLGCMGSLDASHRSYVRGAYTREQFRELVNTYTPSIQLQELLMTAYDVGKGDLPHLLTQREGHRITLCRDVQTYRLEDYPEKDREALQDPATRTYAFFDKSRSYMQRDLLTTLALYVAVNKMVMDSVGRCCLVLNTAQQYTTTYFFHHYAGGRTGPRVNSDNSKPIVDFTTNKNGTRTKYKTCFYLLNAYEDKMVKAATYGGKTLPRVVEWNREKGDGDYLQLDESGMYADRLQRCEYPYGRHLYSVSPQVCGRVMKLWQETLGNPDRLRYPRHTSFPYMFIAKVTLKMPSLCIDPGVAYITEDGGELQWSICDKEGLEQGVRTQYLTNVDLATKMAEGAELIRVEEVLFWEYFGFIFESYLEKINTLKYTSTDSTQKGSAKLAANAFYGATLKTDHHTIFAIYDPNDPEREKIDDDRIDHSEIYNYAIFGNGKLAIQAKAKIDVTQHASRPNYTGAFVLSHSKYKLSTLVRVSHGPNFLPTTKQQALDGLRYQCLYGDTDSLYLHSTHLARVLEHDDRQTDPNSKLLFDQMPTDQSALYKLGKFCDEPSNDCGCGDKVDFRTGSYGKVVRFASNAPKSYTVTYELPNGTTKYKSRLKGVKTNGSRIFVDDIGELDERKRRRNVAFDGEDPDEQEQAHEQISKKARLEGQITQKERLEALQKSETKRRIALFDASTTPYSKSSQDTHNAMYTAITDSTQILRTLCQATLKNFGLFPQAHELDVGASGKVRPRAAYDYTVTNVQRDVCSDILTRRRPLTKEEILFLGLDDYDASRILVPYGYNYDRSLFTLL